MCPGIQQGLLRHKLQVGVIYSSYFYDFRCTCKFFKGNIQYYDIEINKMSFSGHCLKLLDSFREMLKKN